MSILKIIGFVFGLIGLVLLAVAGWSYKESQDFAASSVVAAGTVVNLDRSFSGSGSSGAVYRPVVKFQTSRGETIEFRSSIASNPPSYEVGEEVSVRHDPNDPHNASIDSFFSLWLVPLITGGVGFVFTTIGGVACLILLGSGRRERWLRENGQAVTAEVQSVELDRSFRKGSRHPYRIHAQWIDPATRAVYVFRSKPIWYDPQQFIERKEILVWIDPNNPKRHLVDTSFLPESAN